MGVALEGEKWYIHDPNFFKNMYLFLENLGGVVSLYVVNTSIKANSEKLNIGDGFIPSLAQLGLGYDSIGNLNITMPIDTNPLHIDSINEVSVWRQALQAIRNENLITMALPNLSEIKSQNTSIVINAASDYSTIGPVPPKTGSLLINLQDEYNNNVKRGSLVTISDENNQSNAIFSMFEDGRIFFNGIPEGNYFLQDIISTSEALRKFPYGSIMIFLRDTAQNPLPLDGTRVLVRDIYGVEKWHSLTFPGILVLDELTAGNYSVLKVENTNFV